MENKLTSSLVGLNALICGSTSGIGLATAIEFSKFAIFALTISRQLEGLKG